MQLDLAGDLGLPVILHSRESIADLLLELTQWARAIRTVRPSGDILGVLHAFSGDLGEAQAAWEMGFQIGLGGPITFTNARRLHELAPQLRLERLVLETDAPYLAPHPYRGQRNEPAYLPKIAEALALRRGMKVDMLAAQTTRTAAQTFSLALELEEPS
jgi:TatD DNase family protein